MTPGPARPLAISPPRCVGRDRELTALAQALAAPRAVILLEGEAGIGKTRLLREFFDSPACAVHRSLVAACTPFREPYTLSSLVDAVRQATGRVAGLRLSGLAGALRPLFPEWAAELPPLPEPLEDATAARHRLFRALLELLNRLNVAVLVAEDVHWADEATLEFLLFVVSRRPQPMSVVVTYRPEDVPAGSLLLRLSSRVGADVMRRRLAVGPLDAADTGALVSSMLAGERVSAEFASFLHRHTDGVPLAIEESIRLMHERNELAHRAGGWVRRRVDVIAVPPTIRDAVLERVARLGPGTQTVLRAAAVLANAVDQTTLAAVAGLPEDVVAAAVVEALGCGLLREDPRGLVSFRHWLAYRAVYETISARDRHVLHLRAGRFLERVSAPPEQLARHFREAGDTEAWCRYAEQTADRATQTGDETAAAALLHNLVTTVALPVAQLVRLIRKIKFESLSGSDPFTDILGVLRAVLAGGDLSADTEAEARFQLGRVLMVAGAFDEGRGELRRAVQGLPADSVESARARIFLGVPVGNAEPAEEHLRWVREAPTVAPSVGRHERLCLQMDRMVALLMLGEESAWVQAQSIPDEPAPGDDAGHIALAHMNLGCAGMLWGRYGEARQRMAQARKLVEELELVGYLGAVWATDIHLDWFTGAWNGLADRAASLADRDDLRLKDRCEAALVAGLWHAAAGDRAQAEERLRFAGRDGQQHIEAAAALARLWLAEGRVDDALSITDQPVDIAIHKAIWLHATEIAPVRVDALIAAGRLDDAVELVCAFGRMLDGKHAPAGHAALGLCRAVLTEAGGQPAEAAARFARVGAAWQALPRPYEALRAGERQGRCLLAAGDRQDAASVLVEVSRGFSELGAGHDAERVSGAMGEHGLGVPKPRRGGRPGYGDELSPRELQTARLLLDGRTNRQIAEALVVSTPTVKSHLRSAMRKLQVVSRTALALKLVELGLAGDDDPVKR